jgi:hypothetical protein
MIAAAMSPADHPNDISDHHLNVYGRVSAGVKNFKVDATQVFSASRVL